MTSRSLAFRALEFYGTRLRHRGQWHVQAVLRRLWHADVDEELEVERAGLRWVLNPSDFVHADLFWMGAKDRWEVEYLQRRARPGAVMFDIGANFGYYGIAVAAASGGGCRVHAFEPFAPNHARLCRHVAMNGLQDCVACHQVALSHTVGEGQMTVRPDNSGSATLEGGAGVPVHLTTLDAFCAANGVERLDLMKIDVEGHEVKVLEGGAVTLARFRPVIVVEMEPARLDRAGSSARWLAERLDALSYSLHRLRRGRLEPLGALPTGSEQVNVVCVPRG